MNTEFKGEHLLPGHLGQLFVVLSFGGALLSAISYYFSTVNKDDLSWKRMARIGYFVNCASVVGIGVSLFYIIFQHYFEYHYAWEYSSRDLPVYYIISSFWNGQEGSFWLWTFWQGVLGLILIRKAKSWESPVMTTVALSQALLASMLMGVDILGARIGSSPFILLRQAIEGPIFSRPDYLTFIKDGRGMNPLLQNYWMVIHPPTLFLGFASMVVPFAYAIAGLWQKRYQEWVKPAISYALFAVMVLGTGIIMGSFWAYESLNFGGFWAWDPVENASLIPWLTLIGAVHVLIVYKNTGHSYFTATFLTLISFVLVLYASFLTRSGILGDSSVHSFTDLGLFWHLVADVAVFFVIAIVAVVVRWKELPISKKEEETYSREFWMFVGAVFLALSCLQLVVVTSIPVWNAMFKTNIAPPNDKVGLYNLLQGAFAVVVTLFIGFTQFMKYKKTESTRFFISSIIYLVFAAVVASLAVWATGIYHLKVVFWLVMFGSVYAILANAKVMVDAIKGKFKLAGSAVAHIGFGLILVGALIAAGTSKVVSVNNSGIGYGAEFDKVENARENIMLYKNEPVTMGDYQVTYFGDSVVAPNHYFKVEYKKFDANGKVTEDFVLRPRSQANPEMSLVSSPDTKHYLFHDLYTHVTMAPIRNEMKTDEDGGHSQDDDDKNYDAPITHEASIGDTIPTRDGHIVIKALNKETKLQNITLAPSDVAIGAVLEIVSHGKTYQAEPIFMIKSGNVFDFYRKVDDAGLKLRFTKLIPQGNTAKVQLMIYQQPQDKRSYIVMRAIDFPFINFFWSGTIIMVIGFLLSIFRRNKEWKNEDNKPKKVKRELQNV